MTIPGPDPARLPVDADGPYKLLLRIEASDDKEATSKTGGGRLAVAGGAAGFPMSVLRHVVGGSAGGTGQGPTLLSPAPGAQVQGALDFACIDPAGATLMRLEVQAQADGRMGEMLSALVAPGTGRYGAPPWFMDASRGQALRWRVQAIDAQGHERGASEWRALQLR